MTSSEQPFKIAVSQQEIDLLKAKLNLAAFPDELDEAGWLYGAPLADVKRLVARWKDGFDWRAQERKLNEELPQFTRDIDVDRFGTLNIHYVHARSTLDAAIPLLFVHGWPGSFIEVRKILPMLTRVVSDQPSFHVVTLSLPGYGFSAAPKKTGFRTDQYAEVCNKLMLALGYNEYVTQGGDWGGIITRRVASLYGPKHAKAWHTNFPLAEPPETQSQPATHAHLHIHDCTTQETGIGYLQLQSTKPQTLGYALSDSPVGLLAWIYEKLVAWTDGYEWDDDEVLTWISVYWFSRAGPAASLRIYYENSNEGRLLPSPNNPADCPDDPDGPLVLPQGSVWFSRATDGRCSWVRRTGNVVAESVHAAGGHFAAHEVPELLVSDLHKMFRRGGGAYGVVPGHIGSA
ncbi:EHN domain-containing protein [Mycena kentingensis (nom. inval.)]|nr:EHN domain-containing protein [Mycena kentingensis (nom. inval.)]